MAEEIKSQGQTSDLGKAETPNLGQAGNPAKEEVKKVEPDNGGLKKESVEQKPPEPPTDFKIAEIWIRSGQIMLDASESFWTDRCRALGVLDLCKDIVKTAEAPKPKVIPVRGSFLNGLRRFKFGRRK